MATTSDIRRVSRTSKSASRNFPPWAGPALEKRTNETPEQASDEELSGPDSPQYDVDMDEDDEHESFMGHDRTQATFAHIESTRTMTAEETEKWKSVIRRPQQWTGEQHQIVY